MTARPHYRNVLRFTMEHTAREIAAAMELPAVAHYGDDAWREFLADHDLPEDTEIAYIDARGRITTLP